MGICKNISSFVCLAVLLFWLPGCVGFLPQVSAPPLALSPDEHTRLGTAVGAKLLQVLGGPYHDKELAADLNRVCGTQASSAPVCAVAVADSGEAALYPLPGGQVIITRGLLAEAASGPALLSLLTHARQLAVNSDKDRATRSMNKAIREFLANPGSPYNPAAADIRLARLFKETGCEQDCLTLIRKSGNEKVGSAALPVSIQRLAGVQAAYMLLEQAKALEKSGDQAQAIATYLQAAVQAPDEPRVLESLGLAYLRAGQLQPARLHLQRAIKLQPDYYRSLMGLGYLHLQMDKLQLANQVLAESVRLLPVTENLFLLAEAREKSGDVEGAMLLYRVIVASDRYSKLGRTSASRLAPPAGDQ